MLTDKAKIDFEKWYFKKYCKSSKPFIKLYPHEYSEVYDWFYETLTFSFQYGVYIEWFDSVGITIEVSKYNEIRFQSGIFESDELYDHVFSTRKKAIKSAIQKANELYNTTHP